ncbi:pathogenesis-related protein PR-1-like [Magnolia sinica]|uniref:pathogenesis-related protein PR-1-like n=1 Tax=Magnolia sinica TaxID=86752 RepID=UPI002658A023|nr:pathogenesis-related protein PR-1-like [Magnolia sinica]
MATAKSLLCLFWATFLLLSSLLTPVPAQTQRRATDPTPEATTIEQFLNPQNEVRMRHGLPPLEWSTKLETFARWYAGQRQDDCALIHSVGDLGENLFRGSGRHWKPSDAVAAWAAEESIYDYKSNQCSQNKVACTTHS